MVKFDFVVDELDAELIMKMFKKEISGLKYQIGEDLSLGYPIAKKRAAYNQRRIRHIQKLRTYVESCVKDTEEANEKLYCS